VGKVIRRYGMSAPWCVPPSREVMAMLYMQYRRSEAFKKGASFRKYLESIGFVNPADDNIGMDDRAAFRATAAGPELIDIPSRPVTGTVSVKVLLVDFADRAGSVSVQHYEDLLFSDHTYPTGSVRDFYKEVSLGKARVTGSVHGWLRMPQPYSYYTNGESGMRAASYPHNARRMAEDAVKTAIQNGVSFEADLDKFGQGIITALVIVHAGRGAEVLAPPLGLNEIWSHKWALAHPVDVAPNLAATIYLTVPEDCKVGVCAHELGHLVFQWQDFYDPNYDQDGNEWDGSGVWDLMAGGSYNGNGARPAHPAGLHKMQHGWIQSTIVKTSKTLTIRPYTSAFGRVYKLVSNAFHKDQYLLLENRRRTGFDFGLPASGLLVWKVDESGEQETTVTPGLALVEADGRHDLTNPNDWDEGDAGDPFPGSSKKTSLGDTGETSTSFRGSRSGIVLDDITRNASTGVIKVRVTLSSTGVPAKGKRGSKARGAPRRSGANRKTVPHSKSGRRKSK
jgi:immune inhibitor A